MHLSQHRQRPEQLSAWHTSCCSLSWYLGCHTGINAWPSKTECDLCQKDKVMGAPQCTYSPTTGISCPPLFPTHHPRHSPRLVRWRYNSRGGGIRLLLPFEAASFFSTFLYSYWEVLSLFLPFDFEYLDTLNACYTERLLVRLLVLMITKYIQHVKYGSFAFCYNDI